MINKVTLVGHLGSNPEVRSTPRGQLVASIPLATRHRWRDRDGDAHEETEWHSVVCFGRQAEIAAKYLSRGRLIYVDGRIKTRSWEDRQTGETRTRTEIVCESFQMLSRREDSSHTREAEPGTSPEPQDDPQ